MDTKKLRQKILDLAIRGKLVPQDPNDEPASILLERIKAEKERLIKEGKIKRSKKSAKTSDTPHYENVPFEVPKGWAWTRFGSICKKLTDGSHNPPPKRSNGYTVISAQNIKNGKIIFTDKDRYTDEIGFQKENPRTQITKGDIILGIIGGSIGNVAIYDLSDPVVAQRSISIIDTYVLNIYCFYLLQSTIFQSLFLEKSIGNAQAGIYLGELDKLYIPLPPIREQNRIVSEIKRWFTLIDEIEQGKADLQTTIKQTKSKILDLAIHGKLVPQDPNDEPASELLKRINPKAEITCDNGHYGKIPQRWALVKLGDLFDAISAKRVLKSEWKTKGVPFYRAREIAKLSECNEVVNELFIANEHYNELKKKYGVPEPGDIMLSAVGTIGKSYIVKNTDKFYYKDASVLCLRNYNKLNPIYFSMLFSSSFLQNQMNEYSKGTTVDTITLERLKSYIIPLPPLEEQKRIVVKIAELFFVLDNILNALEA